MEARLGRRGGALVELHALEEREGLHASVAGANGGDVSRELVENALLVHIRGALVDSVLAGEDSVGILLGVSIGDHLQCSDGSNVGLRQGLVERKQA